VDRYEYRRSPLQQLPALQGCGAVFPDTLVEEPTHGWLSRRRRCRPKRTIRSAVPDDRADNGRADLRELASNAIEAARTLGIDTDLQQQWSAPGEAGAAADGGQLQEWL
jgi:hypothetical protein